MVPLSLSLCPCACHPWALRSRHKQLRSMQELGAISARPGRQYRQRLTTTCGDYPRAGCIAAMGVIICKISSLYERHLLAWPRWTKPACPPLKAVGFCCQNRTSWWTPEMHEDRLSDATTDLGSKNWAGKVKTGLKCNDTRPSKFLGGGLCQPNANARVNVIEIQQMTYITYVYSVSLMI